MRRRARPRSLLHRAGERSWGLSPDPPSRSGHGGCFLPRRSGDTCVFQGHAPLPQRGVERDFGTTRKWIMHRPCGRQYRRHIGGFLRTRQRKGGRMNPACLGAPASKSRISTEQHAISQNLKTGPSSSLARIRRSFMSGVNDIKVLKV